MILQRWRSLSKNPLGRIAFDRYLRWFIPYTGTIRPHVLEIGESHSRVELRDRKRVRNHLNSIHAVALMNVAELSTGLSLFASRSDRLRIILVNFEIEFVKKARGSVIAEARCPMFDETAESVVVIPSEIKDQSGDVVCRAKGHWKVGPKKS